MQEASQEPSLAELERRSATYEWFLHNIVFGFAGVWVPFFALMLCGYLRWREAVADGEFVMFAVTLSAVSLGFFMKDAQINLRKTEMPTYIGLMLTMLVGVITRTGLAFGSKYPSVPINMAVVGWITLLIVPFAIFLNYRLFTLEQELIDRSAVERKFNQPAKEIIAEAREHASVDNIKL